MREFGLVQVARVGYQFFTNYSLQKRPDLTVYRILELSCLIWGREQTSCRMWFSLPFKTRTPSKIACAERSLYPWPNLQKVGYRTLLVRHRGR